MKISTADGKIKRFFSATAMQMIADAGFEAVDYSLTNNSIPWETGIFTNAFCNEFVEHFKSIGKIAADFGVEIYQTHAPYCRPNCVDSNLYSIALNQTIRAIYATGYMNSPYIVAHPVTLLDCMNGQNRELGIRKNIEYFENMAPALRETGVTVCIENLFWGERGQPGQPNICSNAEDLNCLIDTLNDTCGPHFAACLDTGHALVAGCDPIQMLRELEHRARVLHIQDCDGVLDSHWIPGKGVIDWDAFLAAMKEVGYTGTFNFEVDNYFADFTGRICQNKAVWEKATALLYTIGRTMIDRAEVE